MEYNDGFVSKEHRELARSAPESADPLSVSPLQNSVHSRSPKNDKSPNSPGHQTELGQAREFLAKGVLRREAHLSMKDIHILQKTAVPKKKVSKGKKRMTIDLTPFRD